MHRKYLEDIGVKWDNMPEDDHRRTQWAEERELYGFDERETWALDYYFYMWLYERLKMYVEKASKVVDLEYHKFEYEGEELTQIQCINRMIEGCKIYLENESGYDWTEEENKIITDVSKIWALVLPAMWW